MCSNRELFVGGLGSPDGGEGLVGCGVVGTNEEKAREAANPLPASPKAGISRAQGENPHFTPGS